MLKVDLHTHTGADAYHKGMINFSPEDLIRVAAKKNYDVLAITHHNKVFFSNALKDFARKKGIVLIPGAEPTIKRKEVLLLNINDDDLRKLRRIDDLEKIKDHALIVAPHPFFYLGNCLGHILVRKMRLFDAIEYSHYYTRALINPFLKFLNGNTHALEVSKKYNKPIIGTSDAHKLYEFGRTYTLVDSEKNKDAVLDAVKKGRVKLETRPMPMHLFFNRAASALINEGVLAYLKGMAIPDIHRDKFIHPELVKKRLFQKI